jgi:hypothetical protein
MFHQYDLSGNGSLSYQEFSKLLTKVFHMTLNKQELETLIDQFDVNQDGEIDIQEFLIFIQSEQKNFDEVANNPEMHTGSGGQLNASLGKKASKPTGAAAPKRRSPSPPKNKNRPSSAPRLRPGKSSNHNQTAPGVIEGHRIHSSRKQQQRQPQSLKDEENEEEDSEVFTELRKQKERGQDEEKEESFEDHLERVEKQLAFAKKKLNQTESNIHSIEKMNSELTNPNKKPALPPSSSSSVKNGDDENTEKEVNNNNNEKTKKKSPRDSLTYSATGAAVPTSQTARLHEEADVVWMTRMLQAQAEIESRLGSRYYKNH